MSTDIKMHIQSQLNFNPIQRERKIIISPVDQLNILDINMRFFGQPSQEINFGAPWCIEDLRFYINGIEFTNHLEDEIKELILKKDINEIKNQYQIGVNNWFKFLPHFDGGSISIDNEKAKFKNILNSPITDQLKKLGDITSGTNGGLNIINYLYSYIDIDSISINNLISRKYSTGTDNKTIFDFVPITFTFSHGPAPSYSDFTNDPPPRGQLNYYFDLIYENPLYNLMKNILAQTNSILLSLETQRKNYYEPIINQLQTIEQDTDLRLTDLKIIFEDSNKPISVPATQPSNKN